MPTDGRSSRFVDLYNQVDALLADGHFSPGARISVKELADRLGVSPTPLREILSRLVGRDLVEERRAEGYYLIGFDARRISELYALHHHCVALAMRDAVPPASLPLATVRDVWLALDILVQATGNTVLLKTRRYLDAHLKLLRRCERRLFDDIEDEAAEQIAALASGDGHARRRAVRTFHRRRIAQASQLAFCMTRSSNIQI